MFIWTGWEVGVLDTLDAALFRRECHRTRGTLIFDRLNWIIIEEIIIIKFVRLVSFQLMSQVCLQTQTPPKTSGEYGEHFATTNVNSTRTID